MGRVPDREPREVEVRAAGDVRVDLDAVDAGHPDMGRDLNFVRQASMYACSISSTVASLGTFTVLEIAPEMNGCAAAIILKQSFIDRSEEKKPLRATFRMAERVQASVSAGLDCCAPT